MSILVLSIWLCVAWVFRSMFVSAYTRLTRIRRKDKDYPSTRKIPVEQIKSLSAHGEMLAVYELLVTSFNFYPEKLG